MIHITDEQMNDRFHKSSYSGGGRDNCVEVADLTGAFDDGSHAVRDTQHRHEGALLFGPDAFFGFMAGVKGSLNA